jgi:HEAT repeat protein
MGKPNIENMKAKGDVKGLIKALKVKDKDIRNWAASALIEIGKPAIGPLIQALKDKDNDVRNWAASALIQIGEPAVEPLIYALNDIFVPFTERVEKALGKIGKPAVELLIQVIIKDEHTRWRTLGALKEIGEAAVEPLINALQNKDKDIRNCVAGALGEMGEPAVEPLIKALKDEYKDVRKSAAKALGKMKWEPKNDVEKAWYLAGQSAWGELIKLGEPAVEPLIQALEDEVCWVREEAAEALGKIGDKRAVEPLIQALKDDDSGVPEKAVGALVNLGNTASKAILSMSDWKRQIEYLWALAKIERNPGLIPDIVNWLFATPKYHSRDLRKAEDALETLSPYSNLNEEIIGLLIRASSRIVEGGKFEGSYDAAIEATKQLCVLNNPVTTNLLHIISQKKDIRVDLKWVACEIYDYDPWELSFDEQRRIATEELKRRGFTGYDPSVYFKK